MFVVYVYAWLNSVFWQAYARGSFGRERFIELRANVRATTIQRIVRGWLARRRYNKVRRGIIKLQAHVRRHAAKKELKRRKVSVCCCRFCLYIALLFLTHCLNLRCCIVVFDSLVSVTMVTFTGHWTLSFWDAMHVWHFTAAFQLILVNRVIWLMHVRDADLVLILVHSGMFYCWSKKNCYFRGLWLYYMTLC